MPIATVIGQTPEAPHDLQGPVKQIEVRERVLQGTSPSLQGETSRRELLRFDDGDLVEQYQFVPIDNFLWRTSLSYDSQGRIVEWESYNSDGELSWRYEYSYDDQGRRRREIVYDSAGNIDSVLTREYANDRLAEEVMYNGQNEVEWRRAYDYSNDGHTRSWSIFYSDGGRIKQVTQEYDDRDRLIEETHVNEVGALYEEIHYEYDSSSEPVQVEVFDEDGDLTRREEYEFDSNGNTIVERISRPQEEHTEIVVRSYEYDRYGNWITRRTARHLVRDGEQSLAGEKVVRRDIEYEEES